MITTFLLTYWTYLLTSVNSTSCLQLCNVSPASCFYAFDYTGLGLGLVGFNLCLARLSWSRSWFWSHTARPRSRSRTQCLMVSLASLKLGYSKCSKWRPLIFTHQRITDDQLVGGWRSQTLSGVVVRGLVQVSCQVGLHRRGMTATAEDEYGQ